MTKTTTILDRLVRAENGITYRFTVELDVPDHHTPFVASRYSRLISNEAILSHIRESVVNALSWEISAASELPARIAQLEEQMTALKSRLKRVKEEAS